MTDLKDLPGLKEDEIAALGPCPLCRRPLTSVLLFYEVTVRRVGWDRSALQQRAGLEMMLTSGVLARVMGPNRDLAKVIAGPDRCAVCEDCADKVPHLLELMRKE